MTARNHQLAKVGQYREQHACRQGGEHDRARYVAARITGFFGQGRYRIEAQERQAQHCCTGHQRIESGFAAVAQQWRKVVDRATAAQRRARQRNEHHDENHLGADDQVAGLGHRTNADDVEHGHQRNRGKDEHPGRDGGKGDVEEQPDQQVVDHRDEQVIEQQRPAGEKADVRAEGNVGVGICGAGNRVTAHHDAVGRGGEQHGGEGHQIGPGGTSASGLGDDAVGGEYGQRHHIDQSEKHQGGQSQHTAKLFVSRPGEGVIVVGHLESRYFFYTVARAKRGGGDACRSYPMCGLG